MYVCVYVGGMRYSESHDSEYIRNTDVCMCVQLSHSPYISLFTQYKISYISSWIVEAHVVAHDDHCVSE